MSMTAVVKPGVHFALVGSQGVLMDLLADRYFGLTEWSARVWLALEAGSPPDEIAQAVADDGVPLETTRLRVEGQLKAWRQSGLMASDDSPSARSAVPQPRSEGAARAALDPEAIAATPVALGSLFRFLRAALFAGAVLRWRGLGWALRRLQQMPTRALAADRRSEVIRRTMRVYVALRRLFRQGRMDCLPRAVTLATALRRQGVDAQVCFGVRNFPFLAHAWVEADGVAVNEKIEKVRAFVLIARF